MQRSSRWGVIALFIALAGLPAMAWADTAKLPAGYRLAQKLVTQDGSVLQVLEDQRISAQMHKDSWGSGLDEDSFDEPGDLVENPLLGAQVRLLSASGDLVAHDDLGYPLAEVKKAPLKGLPDAVYFLIIDQTAPMGSYSGPATQLLLPAKQKLEPMSYKDADGKVKTLTLAQTGKAAWRVASPVKGGADELLQVSSFMDGDGEDDFATRYQTYRFVDGQWQVAVSQKAGYWDTESDFPTRTAFP
ncbi:hypothetical protein [Pseudomonas marginalis]|uniref:DUF4198 domain-containing protein n=2 Tax=Pseudomonas marginalis TaxID=298 RepID=A0A3M4A1F6_PSEMA|nr:hypothetical protein [Pseudomonas marginalis]OAJ49489.1 hypothetical protein AO064_00405 [Pseudomonas marginalis]RMO63458.1 hypothetical protein ALQ38_01588 [Pseudomonas marginalis pv. marginalis]RMO99954.1 hypothetical protein ALQ29_02634 [Pseudomonas marginalis pv. marginalis]